MDRSCGGRGGGWRRVSVDIRKKGSGREGGDKAQMLVIR